ncbi:CRISPR-associated endonuclease Cas1 [Gloeobacter kilaueensis]|uniref:CRISPR-associated endonuclease Cas1 n=1 Tax=Gloeobacter kilaueensis (strain ATCC BAA-2537 / CCAP 1431/1 / ULC 316 / JS1) TaxID=1183438 RepID=U5QN26_GLOK1|nr:CRISPR-associated endonuclease Cas1 [Gloeobacter kilaueensis]AGY60306.1 CRISPR-associated protein Cas1 [Gloeobacter kilaueensis JS1]
MSSLYLLEQGIWVGKDGEQLAIHRKREVVRQIPLPLIDRIFVFGRIHLSIEVLRTCLRRRIPLALLSRQGWLYGTLSPPQQGRLHLRRAQQRVQEESERSLRLAQSLVEAKIHNQRVLLQRLNRRRPIAENEFAVDVLRYLESRVPQTSNIAALLGNEGAAAAQFYPAYGRQLQDSEFRLVERIRRPPTNPANAVLSFGYSLLWNHVRAVVELHGCDPYLGHLHVPRDDHLALISDLIEPFRTPIIDSLVLTMVNRRMFTSEDFEYANGACFLADSGRRKFVTQFQQIMGETIQLPNGRDGVRWKLIDQGVENYKTALQNPELPFNVYRIR